MNRKLKALPLILILIFITSISYGEDLSDCLIQNDIGSYKKVFNGSKGTGSGIIALAGHFGEDHNDFTCRISYSNGVWVDVQVNGHEGADSDRWLLHEAESYFRNYFGLPGDSYVMRQMTGNTIMADGSGGWVYRWLSGDRVIHIEYTDLQMTKPEPLEVVNAYLAKHPSTLPSVTSADLRTDENKTKWIKDEMERRLWLCDKWFQQLDESKTEQYKALSAVVNDHLEVFLDYREKYYGISAGEEKQILFGYLQALNEKEIRNKLSEYKQWWAENKAKPINLP